MMTDSTMTTVSRRLEYIEGQLQSLRADIDAACKQRPRARALPAVTPEQPTIPLDKIQEAHAHPIAALEVELDPAQPTRSAPAETSSDGLGTWLSGRGLAVAGVLLMLIGAAYFLDLSFTRDWISPLERIALGVIAGFGLIAGSMRLLSGPYRLAAEGAIGLGAGITYLASWAAVAVFPDLHIPHVASFATMAAATCALGFSANRWRSEAIALMGLAAAYLTPVLSGGDLNRAALAAYLLIVTGGLLVLARRRAFRSVEILAVAATLVSSFNFIPNEHAGWSPNAAAVVASLFFLVFAIASTVRPLRNGVATTWQLLPLIGTTTLYVGVLEILLRSSQTVLGIVLLLLATLLVGTPALIKSVAGEGALAYRYLGLLALNLALRSLLHRMQLFDSFAIEAAGLTIFGARIANAKVTRIGLGLFALAATGLAWNAATEPPALTIFTPLMLGFVIWLQAAISARRAIPANMRAGFTIGAHVLAFASITRACLDATGGPAWDHALPSLTQVTLSLTWALFAACLFASGVAKRRELLRMEGLCIFAITIVKVFVFDLSELDVAYRIFAFCGTGIVLFLSSAWYLRSMRSITMRHSA